MFCSGFGTALKEERLKESKERIGELQFLHPSLGLHLSVALLVLVLLLLLLVPSSSTSTSTKT